MIIQISASETRTAYGVFSCHHPVHEGAPAATSGSIVDDTRHLQDLTIRGPAQPGWECRNLIKIVALYYNSECSIQ